MVLSDRRQNYRIALVPDLPPNNYAGASMLDEFILHTIHMQGRPGTQATTRYIVTTGTYMSIHMPSGRPPLF